MCVYFSIMSLLAKNFTRLMPDIAKVVETVSVRVTIKINCNFQPV